MEKRTLLAFVLCLVILYVWQGMVQPPKSPVVNKKEEIVKLEEIKKSEEFSPIEIKEADFKGEDIVFKHSLFTAVFTTRGASLKSFSLNKYKVTSKKDSHDIDLVPDESKVLLPLSLYSTDDNWKDLSSLRFSLVKNEGNIVEFSYRDSKREVLKKIIFKNDRYEFDIETIIKTKNLRTPSSLGYILVDRVSSGSKPSLFNPGAQENMLSTFSDDELTKKPLSSLSNSYSEKKAFEWIAFDSKYFLTAFIPESQKNPIEIKSNIIGNNIAALSYVQTFDNSNKEIILKTKGYFGPKLLKQLEATGSNLKEVIDLGWFSIFAIPLLKLLNIFYQFFHNYGIAIILLTILIKIAFYPLSQKSIKSMKEMQRIQPQIQAIKEQHKEDKEKLNKEMINLMKTNNVSPMGGCLPLLFQMPIFFALYRVLYSSVELFHAPFFGWIHDLSSKDPFFVTPIAMGLLMVVQQKMTPTTMDPAQKKMMVIMPFMFTFLMLFLPAGLNLYMLVNSILTIMQQYLFNKTDARSQKANLIT